MSRYQLRKGRVEFGLTQTQAAARLGVSQPYLSLLENGRRRITTRLVRRAADLYGLSPTVLPVRDQAGSAGQSEDRFVRQMASLGYPGYSHVRPTPRVNPAEVVLEAVSAENLDARVTEGLPWVLVRYPNMNWDWLVSRAKLRNVQNRLGFLVSVGRDVAEKHSDSPETVRRLAKVEKELERARLASETTLSREAMPLAEREWLRSNRSRLAQHWGVLTSLAAEQLSYARLQQV